MVKAAERGYGQILHYAVIAIAVAMALYHMWAIAFGAPEAILFRGTHLLFALVLVFLLYPFGSKTEDEALSEVPGAAKAGPRLPGPFDVALLILRSP